jgi:hypothetical protein
MGSLGMNCIRGLMTHAECQRCMQHPLHPCGIPADILEMMRNSSSERERSGVRFSPSVLLGCTRQAMLTHDHPWYTDVEGTAWYQVRGHMVHALMDTQGAYPGVLGVLREKRMQTDVPTKHGIQVFMGKSDLITFNSYDADKKTLHIKVVDYKSKTEVSHDLTSADRDHQMQVNMYAWLATKFLPDYLNRYTTTGYDTDGDEYAGLSMQGPLGRVEEVVVDELCIVYVDMRKVRTFTSVTEDTQFEFPLQSRGKRLRPYSMQLNEWMDLAPIHMMRMASVGKWVERHIEQWIDAEQDLPGPLHGPEAQKKCGWCPMKQVCIDIGIKQGLDMSEQTSIRR